MGEVYRARDLKLGRDVAVKVLPEAVASSPARLARFQHEARAVAKLSHPNIVVLYSIEEEDGIPFLTMELVEGGTLATLVTPGGLPFDRVFEIAIALSEALVAAHERGVVHRDLKPGNIMVSIDGRVKVLDFGLAKEVHVPKSGLAETATGTTMEIPISVRGELVGTAPYMAPEQIRGQSVDARSDLYALGVILYELLAGQRPFRGGTFADLSSAILRDTPEPLSEIRPDHPDDLDRIVTRCLEKNPPDRFQTALEVRDELLLAKRVYESGGASGPRHASAAVASIAVLPFVNRSHDAGDEYFAEGLADELLNVLAKIRGLRVAARTSAFQFRETKDDIGTIGRKLNVATLLEGSVRKAGNRVRIAVQLVKASDGYHLWSESYDRTLDDIFEVQDDIARAVVKELRVALLGESPDSNAHATVQSEVDVAFKGRRTNADAHRLYLQGRHFFNRFTREDVEKSIEYYRRALALDPKFALAWAELSFAHSREADVSWVPSAEAYAEAREAAERALALEPDLAEAHAGLGWIQMSLDWDWRGARASFRRALDLAPGSTTSLGRAAILEADLGNFGEATELAERVLELDPLNAATYHNLGALHRMNDRPEDAERAYRKALELTPQRVISRAALSLALLAQGRPEEALAEAAREPYDGYRHWAVSMIHHAIGNWKESNEALETLKRDFADDFGLQIAQVHAVRGELDAAFEWLDRAYAQGDSGLADVKFTTCFRALYADPRWHDLMRKLKLED